MVRTFESSQISHEHVHNPGHPLITTPVLFPLEKHFRVSQSLLWTSYLLDFLLKIFSKLIIYLNCSPQHCNIKQLIVIGFTKCSRGKVCCHWHTSVLGLTQTSFCEYFHPGNHQTGQWWQSFGNEFLKELLPFSAHSNSWLVFTMIEGY